jgi:hypothetical protein
MHPQIVLLQLLVALVLVVMVLEHQNEMQRNFNLASRPRNRHLLAKTQEAPSLLIQNSKENQKGKIEILRIRIFSKLISW